MIVQDFKHMLLAELNPFGFLAFHYGYNSARATYIFYAQNYGRMATTVKLRKHYSRGQKYFNYIVTLPKDLIEASSFSKAKAITVKIEGKKLVLEAKK